MASLGYPTIPETSRIFIEAEIAQGRTLEDIRSDEAVFQRALLDQRLKVERELDPQEFAFFDRALPDFTAFYRANGLNPNHISAECNCYKYAKVFFLDRLSLEQDGVRAEDEADVAFLDEWLLRDYSALGYEVIRVPVQTVQERLDLIRESSVGV